MIIFTPNTVIKSADVNLNFADNTNKISGSFNLFYAPGGTFSTNSTSYVDAGPSVTYTTGSQAERLFIWHSGMDIVTNSAGSLWVTLRIAGTDQADMSDYNNNTSMWSHFEKMYIYDAPANTAVVMKSRIKTEQGGSTYAVLHTASPYGACIRGFGVKI